jgi:hypothetical protein
MSLGMYGDGGSMRGSGIDSVEVSYDEFTCENDECGKVNEAGEAYTDDYGNYIIECEFCASTHRESSLSEDKWDYESNQSEDYE